MVHIVKTGKAVPAHTMRHTGGAEVQLHSFLTSSIDGGEWSASHPGLTATSKDGAPEQAGLAPEMVGAVLEKKTISSPRWDSNPRQSTP